MNIKNWRVEFFRHDLGEPELESVRRVLATRVLTSGEFVEEFEHRFASSIGAKNVIGLSSCTAALHLSLLALSIGPGDEVITTPLTFVATAGAILQAGATPVFVDVEPETGNIDASAVQAAITSKTRAIIPVHLYGQMCDMRALRRVADSSGLALIEDSAHCIEGSRDNVRPGQLGDTACFSFYATKNITSGEGGAVATNDPKLAERLRLLRLHGMDRTASDQMKEGFRPWDVIAAGWKYNMSNIQAALLLPQLDRIEINLEKRQRLARCYTSLLDNPSIELLKTLDSVTHARHLFTILVDERQRDRLLVEMQARGIEATVNYMPVHLLSLFRERFGYTEGNFPTAELIGRRTISLPFYPRMPISHAEAVASAITECLG